MSPAWTPVALDALPDRLARWLDATPGVLRVVVDGPAGARPEQLAESLIDPLRALSRPVVHIRAETFWRDASLRLEYGHQDVESLRTWVDTDALRREVLDPVLTTGRYLPSLRDPRTNRSTRAPAQCAEPDTVLLVSGSLLLGRGLPFDRVIHLSLSPAARARRTPPDLAWTLPAYDAYDDEVAPADHADVVIRLEDPRRPAVLIRRPPT